HPYVIDSTIANCDRAVGSRLAGELALRRGQGGFPADVTFNLKGTAGQSFGAFTVEGMKLVLEGQANDFVGKGLSGGEIDIRACGLAARDSGQHVILGNVALYGATSGSLFAAGRAGERFAVRNSGATAVVEGVGDHGCEYMTGGRAVVLGATGRNFGAGMSGGIAYLYDPDGTAVDRVNPDMVAIETLDAEDRQWLVDIVTRHQSETGSAVAERLLASWGSAVGQFVKIMPEDYRRVLEATRLAVDEGRSVDDA